MAQHREQHPIQVPLFVHDTLLHSAMSITYIAVHLTFIVVCLQAFFYQVKLETEIDEPPATRLASVSLADIIM